MLTYTANDLWTLRHAKPTTRAVRKAIFSAHLWQPGRDRKLADRSISIVSRENNARRHLRVGWLNVRSLASKTVAVHEAVTTNDLDVLVPTETWHCTGPRSSSSSQFSSVLLTISKTDAHGD